MLAVAPFKGWALRKVRDTQHLRAAGQHPFKVALVASLDDKDEEDIKNEIQALADDATAEEILALDGKGRPGGVRRGRQVEQGTRRRLPASLRPDSHGAVTA